jgi:hypothetical protein
MVSTRSLFAPRFSPQEIELMSDSTKTEAAAKLIMLSREIDLLEEGRAALLQRLDQMRSDLLDAGHRATALRASLDLVYDHVSSNTMLMVEIDAIEREIRQGEEGMKCASIEIASYLFETQSMEETIEEAEGELERLSSILIEGKSKNPRGH